MKERKSIKVLVVDDSATVRQGLSRILGSDPLIEVVGVAPNPLFAIEKIKILNPDVITLDIEMPEMDGLTFLRRLMQQQARPVIILSSFTPDQSDMAIRAYEYGAIDVILKPDLSQETLLQDFKERICESVRTAAMAKIARKNPFKALQLPMKQQITERNGDGRRKAMGPDETIIAVGASTGGTEAIKTLLDGMDADSPGMLIVQHMPENFTKSFAERLNQICPLRVKEAEQGDVLTRGTAIIARGNKHLAIERAAGRYVIQVVDAPPVNRHRPSVDFLFRSVSQQARGRAVGILLTGMGQDGARGLLEMKEAGGFTIAQDERSSIVFGMPKEAIALGAANKILPLDKISLYLRNHFV